VAKQKPCRCYYVDPKATCNRETSKVNQVCTACERFCTVKNGRKLARKAK